LGGQDGDSRVGHGPWAAGHGALGHRAGIIAVTGDVGLRFARSRGRAEGS
jgi:hypothetical protein